MILSLILMLPGAVHEPGTKTVIPGKVTGKFSIRIVPHQTPDEVSKLVVDYINAKVSPSNITKSYFTV